MNRQARQLDWFSPVILFPLVYIGYVLLGMLPMSNLWYPPASVLLVFGMGLVFYLAGALLASRILRDAPNLLFYEKIVRVNASDQPLKEREEKAAQRLRWLSYLIIGLGFLASLLVIRSGIPILNPDNRGNINAAVKMLTEGLWFGLGLYFFVGASRRLERGWRALFLMTGMIVLFLVLLAYRTPLIYLAFILLLWWHYQHRPVTAVQLGFFGLLVVLSGTLFSYLRQILIYGVNGWNDYVMRIGIDPAWSWLVPFHLVTREGVSVFQMLAYLIPPSGGMFGQFHLSAFLSAMPGEQFSPRRIVTNLLGNRPQVTTTPSLIGPFYVDFGLIGVAVGMLLLGLVLGSLYILMKKARGIEQQVIGFLYAFLLGMSLIGIHTGILDISTFLMLVFGYLVWRFVAVWLSLANRSRKEEFGP
ncbi:MAG: hypothetical protein BAA01_04255 [Bacillus thermozeamaize]|uniref:Oligosaccharide repeat unit polymerase n=1 Tax=Bacillus thermozeamaize TaxID=230954 RepID=A0A1Y3P9W5_9BACI|nr:MAG: hypothetical protein BAA01_04255 [Bacillus thermozeamaize]